MLDDPDEYLRAAYDYAAGKIEYLEMLSIICNRCWRTVE